MSDDEGQLDTEGAGRASRTPEEVFTSAILAIDDLHACIDVEFKDLHETTQAYVIDLHERLHHSPRFLGKKQDDAARVARELLGADKDDDRSCG